MALVLVLAAILVVTLQPVDTANDLELAPFAELVEGVVDLDAGSVREAVVGALGNLLLFLPLGVVLALRGTSVARTAVMALVLSGSIELAQLVVPGRTTSVDDVLFNVSGAVLGQVATARLRGSRGSRAGSGRPHADRLERAPREPAEVSSVPLANGVAYGDEAVRGEGHAEGCKRQG